MSRIQEQEHTPEPNSFPVYSKDFILKPYAVLDHCVKSKKQMEDFIQAFNKRIEAELTYQKNLNDCAKMLEKYIDPNSQKCLSYISSAFKVGNQQRGNQARQLAESLKTEVTEPMSQSLKKFTNSTKKAQKSFKKLNKDYSYFFENYKKSKQDFNENDSETKQMIITKNIYKFTTEFSQEKKNKLITKTMQSIRSKMQFEKNYKRSISQFNQLIQVYQKEATEILNELQLAVREQIKLESDGIRKLIVSQVSMFKNVQYDLINISKQMEKMYGQNDIQQFKKQATSINNQDDSIKDMTLKIVDFDKNMLTLSLKNVEQDYYPWLLNIKKNKNMRKIMELRMKQLNVQQQPQEKTVDKIQEKECPIQVKKQDSPLVKQNTQPQKKQQNTDETKTSTNGQQIQIKQKQVIQQKIKQKTSDQTTADKKNSDIQKVKTSELQTQWQNLPKQFFNPPPNPNGIYQKFSPQQSLSDFLQLSQIINGVWVKGDKLQGEAKKKYTSYIQKNHFLRVLCYLFVQQYRIQHKVLMMWSNYQKAVELIKILIDTCQKFGDVFTLKGILALIFTFYSIKQQKAKKLLYQAQAVYDCFVWKKQDYWQASIFQSTYQEMVNFTIQKGQTNSQTLLREKNIIFSQLASYCHYMLMLGATSKNVRRIVGRYCRLYEMTEDQNKDLSKMISNTTKQLKQLNNTTTQNAQSSVISAGQSNSNSEVSSQILQPSS